MRARSYLAVSAAAPMLAALIAPLALGTASAGAAPAAPVAMSTSSADSYGVLVDVRLLQGNVPVNVGPLVESSAQFPPGGAPVTTSLAQVPATPADGSLIQNIGAVQTTASADGTPKSVASAQTANVKLLPMATIPTISADLIKSVSTTTCDAPPSSAGTQFVNLKVGPVAVPANPPPNTTIGLGAVTVIVNEQHPTADGRGLVVNALHIIAPGSLGGTPLPTAPLIQGDIIISHAVSTVVCFNADGSPGPGTTATADSTPILLNKKADPTTTTVGGPVKYTATITNRSTKSPCLVNELIDHLPVGFTPTSTDGVLGSKLVTKTRPDNGIDVIVVPPTAVTIAPGATSGEQHFNVTASTTPGTYANNLELLCSDLGDFVSTGAPVVVTATPAPAAPTPANVQAPAAALPRTGGPSPLIPIGGAVVLAGAVAVGATRRRRALR